MSKSQGQFGLAPTILPVAVLSLHSMLVIAVACMISMEPSSEALMLWCLFLVMDFPVSVPYILFDVNFGSSIGNISVVGLSVRDVWLPAVWFGLLGGIQYYAITLLLILVWQKRKHRKERCDISTPGKPTMKHDADQPKP